MRHRYFSLWNEYSSRFVFLTEEGDVRKRPTYEFDPTGHRGSFPQR